jgi:YHS domain-containing protein
MKKIALALLLSACESKSATPPAAAASAAARAPAAGAGSNNASAGDPAPIPIGTKMKCAVTGEDFTVSEKTVQVTYSGKRFAFCCADCLPTFNKDPAKYAAK